MPPAAAEPAIRPPLLPTVNAGRAGLPEIANLWDEVARSYRLLIVLEEREIALQASGCARSK
jgi:hypothetical protein